MIVKCLCNHCGGHIEFEADGFQPGTHVDCPHCKMETLLALPVASKSVLTDSSTAKLVRGRLEVFRTILVTAIFILGVVAVFLLERHHGVGSATSVTWEYETLSKFEKPQFSKDQPNKLWITTVCFMDVGLAGSKLPDSVPRHCYSFTGVLNYVGDDGWEMVSYDGEQYIFKRPRGTGIHTGFTSSYELTDKDK